MNKIFFSMFVALFFICGCGGGSGGGSNSTLPIEPGNGGMSGQWEGTLTYENGGSERANFVDFSQNGANISGIHELFDNGVPARTDDVSGSVTNSTVTISAIYRSPDSADFVELAYEGTVDGDVYRGNLHVTGSTGNNPRIDQRGTFTFTRGGGNPQPNPQSMSGVWQGMMATPESGQYDIIFDLEVSEGRISGNFTYTFAQSGQTNSTEFLIGTVDNSTVNIEVALNDAQNNEILLTFEGNVRGDTFAGNISVTSGNTTEQGTFTTTKIQNRNSMAQEYTSTSDEDSGSGIQDLLDEVLRSE